MRLFHVSEEPNITEFVPRIPHRKDVDRSKGLVWALNERCLPNFLTPRNCPRVTYHATDKTTPEDIARFFSSASRHTVAIENARYRQMTRTTLYVYEFDTTKYYRQNSNIRLQDEVAGYYVSEETEIPISVAKYDDLFEELFSRNVEVRILASIWELGDAVQQSTLNWSLCRMAYAQPRI